MQNRQISFGWKFQVQIVHNSNVFADMEFRLELFRFDYRRANWGNHLFSIVVVKTVYLNYFPPVLDSKIAQLAVENSGSAIDQKL